MVLRITQQGTSRSGATLRLEGRLVKEMAALLERECTGLLRVGAVNLDLADVSFVDRSGIEVLRRLSRAGAGILCPSGPLASVLEGGGVRVTQHADNVNDGGHPDQGPARPAQGSRKP